MIQTVCGPIKCPYLWKSCLRLVIISWLESCPIKSRTHDYPLSLVLVGEEVLNTKSDGISPTCDKYLLVEPVSFVWYGLTYLRNGMWFIDIKKGLNWKWLNKWYIHFYMNYFIWYVFSKQHSMK